MRSQSQISIVLRFLSVSRFSCPVRNMSMDLTFLGTASNYPMPNRGVSCTVFKSDLQCWMFDCGEGSQTQMKKTRVKATKINKVFITHLHGDHLFGLPGFLCTLSQNTAEQTQQTRVEIYGPLGLRRYLRTCLELSRSPVSFPYVVHELEPAQEQFPEDWKEWQPDHTSSGPLHLGEEEGRLIQRDSSGGWHLFEDDRFVVKAGAIYHRIPCFGYVIQEKAIPGKLDAAKLKELGVPPGPLYSKIKQGEAVTLENGLVIDPKDVVGPTRPGRKIVILGDTHDPSPVTPLAQGADVLVHEATLENSMREKAVDHGHSTPEMAATFGKTIGAKTLILTHFSQRYKPLGEALKKGEESVSKLLEEAEAVFGPNSVIAAQDLQTIPIPLPKS